MQTRLSNVLLLALPLVAQPALAQPFPAASESQFAAKFIMAKEKGYIARGPERPTSSIPLPAICTCAVATRLRSAAESTSRESPP